MTMLMEMAQQEMGRRVLGSEQPEGTAYPSTAPVDSTQSPSLLALAHKEIAGRRSTSGYNSLSTQVLSELARRRQGYSADDVDPEAPDMADDPFLTVEGEFANTNYDYAPQLYSENSMFYKETFDMEVAPWSGRPHFPATEEYYDSTGVTLGPGYDMGGRKSTEVIEDLTAVGVDPQVARRIATAAGWKGDRAAQFVAEWPDEDILDKDQQKTLFERLSTKYEDQIKLANNLGEEDWEELNPTKKKILFDYAWHAGPRAWPKFRKALLTDDVETAYNEYGGRLPVRDEYVKDSLEVLYG